MVGFVKKKGSVVLDVICTNFTTDQFAAERKDDTDDQHSDDFAENFNDFEYHAHGVSDPFYDHSPLILMFFRLHGNFT